MSVRRIVGMETEFGIMGDAPGLNPMLMSAQVVTAYARHALPQGATPRWDYSDEDPLNDARGWRLDRGAAHPTQLTDTSGRAADGTAADDGEGSDGAGRAEGGEPGSTAGAVPDGGGTGSTAGAEAGWGTGGEGAEAGWGTGGEGADAGASGPLKGAAAEKGWPQIREQRRGMGEPEQQVVANAVLTNGARFYVDHAHPEYSGPETTSPRDAVLWDRAGDEIAQRATHLLAGTPGMPTVTLYKNNTDGKGASYGTHENYLVDRQVPFADIIEHLTPFLVTRQVFCGAGRVGLGQQGEQPGFQLSQRADFIEAEVGLETTLRRPIINTRDEPHADPHTYRRLHVIIGDANLVEVSGYLKVGTTALLLWLLETGQVPLELSALRLADPVGAVRAVSRDLSLQIKLDLEDGRTMTAVQIQQAYAEILAREVRRRGGIDEQTQDVLDRWQDILTRLATDPGQCAREVEWAAKLRLLEGMRRRHGIDWDDHRLAAMDLQWSNLNPDKGIYARLAAAGAVDRIVTDAQVDRAITHPPADTRAYFRGEAIRRYATSVDSANWEALTFDLPGRAHLLRLPTTDPYRGTAEHLGELLDAHPEATGLIDALSRP